MTQEYHRFSLDEWESLDEAVRDCIIDKPKLEVYMGQRICKYEHTYDCPFKQYIYVFGTERCDKPNMISWKLKEE